jgi:hypothetical protein
MGSTFDAPKGETEALETSQTCQANRGGRLAALALAVSASAAVTLIPTEAQAQAPSIEFEELDVTLKGTVLNGVLIVSGETGGWFSGNKGTLRIPLTGIVPADRLAELEGREVEVEIEGKKEGGVFKGEIRTKSGFVLPTPLSLGDLARIGITPGACVGRVCAPRPRRSCDRPADCGKPVRRVEPVGDETESGLVRLKKPFDPKTFYVDNPDAGKSMGEGQPRGFDVKTGESLTFFVTGDSSGQTRVSLELYPQVPIDEKKRAAAPKMKVKITIDGEEFELLPQPLPKGKILPSSQGGEVALWDTPVRIPNIAVPAGTHEITVTASDGSSFRVVLRGATETVKPDVDAAIEHPFIEDPDFPPEFSINARLITAPEEPSGYKLEPITKSPVKLDKIHIERIRNSTLVRVRLVMGDVTYESEHPLMPQTDHRVRFTRKTPPGSGNDPDAPDELPLHLKVIGDAASGYNVTVDESTPLPGSQMKCQALKVNFHCWEESKDESRVQAFRTRLDSRPTNPAGNPRHHILRRH